MITRPTSLSEAVERHRPPRGRRWSLLAWTLATVLSVAAAFTFSTGAASAQASGTSVALQQGQMLDDDPLHDGHEEEPGTEGHDGHELDGDDHDHDDECDHEHADDPLHDGHEEEPGTEGHDGHELDGGDADDNCGHDGDEHDDDPLHDGHEEEPGTEGHDGHELDGDDHDHDDDHGHH